MRRLLVILLFLPLAASASQFPFSNWKQTLLPPPTPNFWWDASVLGLANGATVSAIPNRGSTGVASDANLTGSGANPVYATYSQNGASSITFAAGKRYGTGATTLTFPMTVAIITKVTGAPGYTVGAQANNAPAFICYISGGNLFMEADKAAVGIIGTSTVGVPAGGWHLFVFVLTSTTWAYYIDNSPVGSGANAQGAFTGGICIGDQQPVSVPYSGSIGEVIIYNSTAFTAAQLTQINNYSKAKWGTP